MFKKLEVPPDTEVVPRALIIGNGHSCNAQYFERDLCEANNFLGDVGGQGGAQNKEEAFIRTYKESGEFQACVGRLLTVCMSTRCGHQSLAKKTTLDLYKHLINISV
jgi:hypothetical protein